jgi:death-on-curing protein
MTGTESGQIRYLTREDIELIHADLSVAAALGDPVPPFSTASTHAIDALVKLPQSIYFGRELYPTLAEKAAIIFYTLNKKHLFLDANKRMSVACLNVFLRINGKELAVTPDELTAKALWLAETTHTHDFDEVKQELVDWIGKGIR